ncbi:MAG: Nramp family divalent metal transporter [Cytophagales bacterium]|nr:MAG: manganese transporter [Rhodothermaeota bacterium MED-G18]|tara:strand:+ start:17696 stop:18913 length:1218 start_codon:yes stop_codon:yes gene_type:complete
MKKIKISIGPGFIITSAFIGPGTITLCTLSGIDFGYSLIWCIVFSIIATSYLQELSARIGVISRLGLGDIFKSSSNNLLKNIFFVFVFLSLFIGNSAYESGNISGTVMGIETFTGSGMVHILGNEINVLSVLVALILISIIIYGSYNLFEKALVGLVFTMSITFIVTAILSKPDLREIFNGLIPRINEGNFIYVIGLIGTTVVPYNLFLHSYVAKKKWKSEKEYKSSIIDTCFSIFIGGVISTAIIITSAGARGLIDGNEVKNAIDIGRQLSPFLGDFSKYFISIGLLSAGITSSITAPVATSYALSSIFNYKPEWKDKSFKLVSVVVIIIGSVSSSISYNPIYIIKLAQFINGLFLPIIGISLLWAVNQSTFLGKNVNTRSYNGIGILIIILSVFISLRSLSLL